MNEKIVLVDENDNEIGSEEKLAAHKLGKLHRAFSVFIFNSRGQLILQKRARDKYHCGGLWSNTCCSHPRPGENIEAAAHRRLKEEMGFDCDLEKIYSFVYRVKFENGLTEYEYDHVFLGQYDGKIKSDPQEIEETKTADLLWLKKDIEKNPERYTYWFRRCFDEVVAKAKNLLPGNLEFKI